MKPKQILIVSVVMILLFIVFMSLSIYCIRGAGLKEQQSTELKMKEEIMYGKE